MEWSYKWRGKAENYYNLLAMGKIKEEDTAPEVGPFQFYVDAFFELSSCRGANNSIQFTSIVEFAKVFDVGNFDEFLGIIRAMDNTLVRLEDGKRNADKKNTSKA